MAIHKVRSLGKALKNATIGFIDDNAFKLRKSASKSSRGGKRSAAKKSTGRKAAKKSSR